MGEMIWNMLMGKEAATSWNKYRLALDLSSIVIGFFVCRFILLFVPPRLKHVNGEM